MAPNMSEATSLGEFIVEADRRTAAIMQYGYDYIPAIEYASSRSKYHPLYWIGLYLHRRFIQGLKKALNAYLWSDNPSAKSYLELPHINGFHRKLDDDRTLHGLHRLYGNGIHITRKNVENYLWNASNEYPIQPHDVTDVFLKLSAIGMIEFLRLEDFASKYIKFTKDQENPSIPVSSRPIIDDEALPR
ncbi:hypothetical protein HYS50_03335 [Candidatus Woesearchaeota archaeon]|nr:hypothetical protein [Candidatus Woesearchaeota archaeon]